MKKHNWTEDQKYCIEALAQFALGHHHLPEIHEFGTGVCINHCGDLSTFDFNALTRLVVIAHAFAIRFEIGNGGPNRVKIIAHRRKHDEKARIYDRHPDLNHLQACCEEAKEWTIKLRNGDAAGQKITV